MTKSLPGPSEHLKALIDTELALPQYQGEDEDLAMSEALEEIWKTHGEAAFDPINATDQILKRMAQP